MTAALSRRLAVLESLNSDLAKPVAKQLMR